MPLVNWPLIEYTFEMLAVAGVHQIILMVCYHSAAIMEYIAYAPGRRVARRSRAHNRVTNLLSFSPPSFAVQQLEMVGHLQSRVH